MTEVAESFPELGAKSPEKIKPKSAPRGSTRGRDNNGKKPRERKEIPDDGAPLIPPAVVAEPSQEEQEAKEAKIKAEIEDMNKKVVRTLSPSFISLHLRECHHPRPDPRPRPRPHPLRALCAHRSAKSPAWH